MASFCHRHTYSFLKITNIPVCYLYVYDLPSYLCQSLILTFQYQTLYFYVLFTFYFGCMRYDIMYPGLALNLLCIQG